MTSTLHTPAPAKARSRLKKNSTLTNTDHSRAHPHSPYKNKRSQRVSSLFTQYLTRYLKFSPLLIIICAHLLLLRQVFQTIDPQSWKHAGLPSTYLPMLLLLASTTFWTGSYLTLNTSRGLRLSLVVTIYFFLKFQAVLITAPIIIILLLTFLALELFFLTRRK